MNILERIELWVRLRLGLATTDEICEASKGGKDFHDYHEHRGGDGHPSHFHVYKCWNCGKEFTI